MQVALLEDDDPLLVRAGLQQNAEAVKHFKTFTDVHDEASRPAAAAPAPAPTFHSPACRQPPPRSSW